MEVADFWRFLERSREATTDPEQRAAWLEDRLCRVARRHIVDFQIHVDAARRPIDTWDMLGAANLIMDGLCGGDGFWYFQPWLIGQGEHWWRHAARHPDNLADVPGVRALAGRRPGEFPASEWPDWAALASVAAAAYDRVTGEEEGIDDALGERGHRRNFDPELTGATWNTDSLAEIERRLPRLSGSFPRHRHLEP